ncbi:MAG TPA: hypothetical protein VKR79_10420 [Gaiellaceae bacterium]|nr:hypothetical protein [Gaiellaceae bacterium]
MPKRTAAVVAALALVVTGAALAATSGTLVNLHSTSLGKVLASSKGDTLYLLTADPKNKSVCKGSCAQTWPPLLTKGKPRAGKGVKASLLNEIKRGTKEQVTYNGHPLYLYIGDSGPGQVSGEGIKSFGGTWYALNAAGKKVAKTSGGGGGTTTSPYTNPY